MNISAEQFIKNFESFANTALIEPVFITENGCDKLVVLSAEEYARLKCRDRRVVRLEDFTDEEMALIAKADAPAQDAHLDGETIEAMKAARRGELVTVSSPDKLVASLNDEDR